MLVGAPPVFQALLSAIGLPIVLLVLYASFYPWLIPAFMLTRRTVYFLVRTLLCCVGAVLGGTLRLLAVVLGLVFKVPALLLLIPGLPLLEPRLWGWAVWGLHFVAHAWTRFGDYLTKIGGLVLLPSSWQREVVAAETVSVQK